MINTCLQTLQYPFLRFILSGQGVRQILIASPHTNQMMHDDRLFLSLSVQAFIGLLIQFQRPVQAKPYDVMASVPVSYTHLYASTKT